MLLFCLFRQVFCTKLYGIVLAMRDVAKWVVYAGIFAVPFVVLIVSTSMFFPFITGKNFAFRIIVEIALAAWVILALYEPQYRPRFSWIAFFGFGLLVVMFFANLFGEYAPKSFWSNFERMDGYVTLVHFYIYFLMVGTMLTTEKLWNRFFNTTIVAALLVAFYGFAQLAGQIDISQGGWRITSTLGNSTYMAVYMLFHVFITAWMFMKARSKWARYGYLAIGLLFAFLLIRTATRGTTLGLIGGGLLSLLYIAIFSRGHKRIRRLAIGGLIALVLTVGVFVTAKDTAFVENSPVLSRFASISLSEGDVRFMIWGIAWEGVKERPILGWGQANFNYVFNEHYDPRLYNAESWYDRVHNIVLDWLIAGGILGAFFYFGILGSALFYFVIRPLSRRWRRSDSNDSSEFTVVEQGLLLGLLAAYVFHNLFVFDNLISYVFFAVILAVIHSRVAVEIPKLANFTVNKDVVTTMVTPVVLVITVVTVYFVNVPSMKTAKGIIDAIKLRNQPELMLTEFQSALDREAPVGRQETVEQMAQNISPLALNQNISDLEKAKLYQQVEISYQEMIEKKPGDARLHMLFGSFYRFINQPEKALEQFKIALELSPRKQTILYGIGFSHIQASQYETALPYFKEAYELELSAPASRVNYAVAAMYADDNELFESLIDIEDLEDNPRLKSAFVSDPLAMTAAHTNKNYPLLLYIITERIEGSPSDPQERVNLAVAHYEMGDTNKAVAVIEEAIEDIPTFADQGRQIIEAFRTGNI